MNKAPLSVSNLGTEGRKVVFDGAESYIEKKATGDCFSLLGKNGMDALGSARKRTDLRAEDVVAALEEAYTAAGLAIPAQ